MPSALWSTSLLLALCCSSGACALAVADSSLPPASEPSAAAHPVRLELSPARVLEGDPVSVRVTGLKPGAAATIHALSVVRDDAGKRQPFYSEATFTADEDGVIDLASAVPTAGYYQGADMRGLFWSQRPLSDDPAGQAFIAASHSEEAKSLLPGQQVLTVDVGGLVKDRKILTLMSGDSGVVRRDVRSNGLVGAYYCEKGAHRRPVVVVLGGSEGGLDVADWIGPKLASRGFAVLGVEYFSPPDAAIPGVPTALKQIPVELLEKARAWLSARPDADISRFGVIGYSKGAEFALVLASTYDWIRAVVAYAASDFVWQGIQYGGGAKAGSSWTMQGRDLAFLPTTGTREAIQKARASGGKLRLALVARENIAAASDAALDAARIKVEHSHADLLLIGGADDQLWDSGASVQRIDAQLKRSGYPHSYASVVYPAAGHVVIGTGWRPTTTDNADTFQNGGEPAADAHAQADSWSQMLLFLNRALRP